MGLEVSGSVTVPCATGDCTACAAAPPVRLYRLCGCTGCAAVPPKEVTWIVYLHGCNSSENIGGCTTCTAAAVCSVLEPNHAWRFLKRSVRPDI